MRKLRSKTYLIIYVVLMALVVPTMLGVFAYKVHHGTDWHDLPLVTLAIAVVALIWGVVTLIKRLKE